MKIVLNECVPAEDLKSFIENNSRLKDYYHTNYKHISKVRLNIEAKKLDFIGELCERIYDIRCKIVHSKGENSDGQMEIILPFSKEADYLNYDLEVLDFVVQKVIIASGSPLLI